VHQGQAHGKERVEVGKTACAIQRIYNPEPVRVTLEKTAFLGEQTVARIVSPDFFNN
jgi:hypothetical protein